MQPEATQSAIRVLICGLAVLIETVFVTVMLNILYDQNVSALLISIR
jgi:hypothetical protein